MTWYIDTLDPRAGLAFASERTPDLLGQPDDVWDLDDEVSTVFVRAPGFLVEPVPNRAVALAAARGSFQFGLFVDGLEAPFDSVDDVREFVRRAYLRASGGDQAKWYLSRTVRRLGIATAARTETCLPSDDIDD